MDLVDNLSQLNNLGQPPAGERSCGRRADQVSPVLQAHQLGGRDQPEAEAAVRADAGLRGRRLPVRHQLHQADARRLALRAQPQRERQPRVSGVSHLSYILPNFVVDVETSDNLIQWYVDQFTHAFVYELSPDSPTSRPVSWKACRPPTSDHGET